VVAASGAVLTREGDEMTAGVAYLASHRFEGKFARLRQRCHNYPVGCSSDRREVLAGRPSYPVLTRAGLGTNVTVGGAFLLSCPLQCVNILSIVQYTGNPEWSSTDIDGGA
jgi:hypothetical protein